MRKRISMVAFVLCALIGTVATSVRAQSIDRHALVTRHNVVVTRPDPDCPLQVGNGEFAFTADVTGLQTFPEFYRQIPLVTEAHWGWHTTPAPDGLRREDFKYTYWDTYGRQVPYMTNSRGQEELFNWLRENPHMAHLGRIGLQIVSTNGSPVAIEDLKNIHQTLDLWSGVLTSRFEIEGQPVEVQTCCHPTRDALAVRIESPCLGNGQLRVVVAFPYPSPRASAADWDKPDAHMTTLALKGDHHADFLRTMDADSYAVSFAWAGKAALKEERKHTCTLAAEKGNNALEFVCAFSPKPDADEMPTFAQTKTASADYWKEFWSTGGAIDLSGSKDSRAPELERRIVLSQYATAINCAGSLPPQETGLVSNERWYGKFHLEMHWWHAAHFALWGRWPLLERSLGYYWKIMPKARELARSQGYRGLRWPKMTDPNGDDSPSGKGALILWQQPHPIFYAELDYRLHPSRKTLEKWKDIVFGTADFLTSYAVLDTNTGHYVLGPPMMIVSENIAGNKARNPCFELSYWRFGLRTAQAWRKRLGLPRDAEWDKVLNNLTPLPVQDGLYLTQEGMTNTYTEMNFEHPGVLGPLGMMPGDGADPVITRNTVRKVLQVWQWDRCWGWDFPMTAMAAARVGEPELAIHALMIPSATRNTYLPNGWNRGGPCPYFPGNGGLLYATAMMAAGWDGAPKKHAPGFPDNGQWVVRWEGLKPAP